MPSDQDDLAALSDLADFEAGLHTGLCSLDGKTVKGGQELYTCHTARFLHSTIEGYLRLRRAGLLDASKQLIRPALEMMFRLRAIHLNPELIFRFAYSEYCEDLKWAKAMHSTQKQVTIKGIETSWSEFKAAFRSASPLTPMLEQELRIQEVAHLANLNDLYESHYRLYCRFTHAALQASSGKMTLFEPEDNRTMAFCALVAMEALEPIGAHMPSLPRLQTRIETFPSVSNPLSGI